MADINTQELYDVKLQLFGVGTASDRFTAVFFASLKYVLNQIRARAEGVSVTTPTSLATDVSLDEDVWYAAVSSGLDYRINGHGAYTLDTKADLRAIFIDDLKSCLMQYQRDSDEVEGRLGDLS